jgi:predicted O-methyltransferase YrrM
MASLSGFRLPRPQRHWTPQYVKDRVQLRIWERRHPDAPWLVAEAVSLLETWLRKGDVVVEFGSGRSTLWLAARVARVISIEHDRSWYARVEAQLEKANLHNVEYHYVEIPAAVDANVQAAAYLQPVNQVLVEPADMILVDGILRDAAAMWALEHVRRGGIVVIDNVNRYLPHATRSPASLGSDGRPPTERWRTVAATVASWRKAWFSNGVTDTAVFFRV